MDLNSLIIDSNADSPGGTDNGLEMRPLSSDSPLDSPKTPTPPEETKEPSTPCRPVSPDFPEAPPSSPMQVTAPAGFGENSETIQSEGVRNLVAELQQMSHAQRRLQIIQQQQEQQLLEAQLPGGASLSASGQQIYQGHNGVQLTGEWAGGPFARRFTLALDEGFQWNLLHRGSTAMPPPVAGTSVAPPDGGYGWVVVLGCFLCMVVVDGISFGFGILLTPIQNSFDAGKGPVSLAGALTTGFYLLVGPMTSALCSRFTYRQVTIFGSILASVSIVSASYMQELWQFALLYGVLGGTGFGVIYITCFSVVGAWFQTKRAFATGTVVCGTGIGLALVGVVGPRLVDAYSWRGALVVFGGLLAQGCVCGALFRPAEVHQAIIRHDEANRRLRVAKRLAYDAKHANCPTTNGDAPNGKHAAANGDSEAERKKKRRARKRAHQCSIMQKIIEDKERQRTTSSGSLNGCIITQDNQLIQPPEGYSDSPRFSQNALNRLVESVRRRGFPGLSRSRQSSMRHIVEAMPQMVADYVSQSQQPAQPPVDATTRGQTLPLPPSGSLPPSRPPSTTASRHNSAASLFHSVERVPGGRTERGPGARDADLQRPLLLQLDGGVQTATSSGAATPSVATPAPTLVSLRNSRHHPTRRSPVGSGSLHYSGSFAQLPPRPASIVASPSSDLPTVTSRQNSFLAHGVPMHGPPEPPDILYVDTTVQPLAQEARGGVIVEACWQMLTPSILRSPTFLLLTISSMLTMFGFLVPNTLLVDFATSLKHSPDKAALLITYLGIANTFGRICTVFYITHVLNKEKPIFGSLSLNNFTLVLAGLITVLLPWTHTIADKSMAYSLLVSYAVVYGFSIAVFVSMRGFIVDEMLGAACLTNAFGYLLLFQGLAVIVGPPLFGWLVDRSGAYRDAFVLGGAAVLLSGILLLPLRRLALWEKQRASAGHVDDFELASAATATGDPLPGAYTPTGGGYEALPATISLYSATIGDGAPWSDNQQQKQRTPTPTPL